MAVIKTFKCAVKINSQLIIVKKDSNFPATEEETEEGQRVRWLHGHEEGMPKSILAMLTLLYL